MSSSLDNLLLQSLMGKLQIRAPNNPFLSQSLEDFFFDSSNFTDDDDEDQDESKTQLAKEESKLEKEIIRLILTGKTDRLKPNSGQAVTIADHHVCVGFHHENASDYRVWEWHGHIMLFNEDDGYTPEYIYGNYFERLQLQLQPEPVPTPTQHDDEEKVANLGLRELIDDADVGQARILHRNKMNADSSSILAMKIVDLS